MVARGSKAAIARHCLQDPIITKHILSKLSHILQTEIASLCSEKNGSTLKTCTTLEDFCFDDVIEDGNRSCPFLMSILKACTSSRYSYINQKALQVMFLAVFCKCRSEKVNTVQKILSVILYFGHCSQQVININFMHTLIISIIIISY